MLQAAAFTVIAAQRRMLACKRAVFEEELPRKPKVVLVGLLGHMVDEHCIIFKITFMGSFISFTESADEEKSGFGLCMLIYPKYYIHY